MLKNGKIHENVLKRSVLKLLDKKSDNVISGPAFGADFSAISVEPDEMVVVSSDAITETSIDSAVYAVNLSANNIAVAGATPIGITTTILLPDKTEESELKSIVKSLNKACVNLGMIVIGGHTEVTGAVTRPVITITGVGKAKKNRQEIYNMAKPGDDIVVTKWVGLSGTSIIAKEKEDVLKNRFSSAFVDRAADFMSLVSVAEDAKCAIGTGLVHALHDVSSGGIYGALWELAQASGIGLEIDLMSIPLKQETVELCEEFELNPYELMSGGALLIAASNGYDVVRSLKLEGINAAVIGKATSGNDRVIINGDERRFLVPSKSDEINKL